MCERRERERQQRRGLVALHHRLGNGRFAGGGLRVGEGVCVCPCVCVRVCITVYSPSAADHTMIKDWVHSACSALSSWCLHLCVCVRVWLCTHEQSIKNTYNQEGRVITRT